MGRRKCSKAEGKLLEAARLKQRTNFDIEMMREMGYCHGVENYSRHLSGRKAGGSPRRRCWTICLRMLCSCIDESHQTVPQVRAMFTVTVPASRFWWIMVFACPLRWTIGL